MDFYFTTSARHFPGSEITWIISHNTEQLFPKNCYNLSRSRAFFKKLQPLGLSLNEGLFPTHFIQVQKITLCSGAALKCYSNRGWVGVSEILPTNFKRYLVFLIPKFLASELGGGGG
jgi:hypothetical protein